MKKIALLAMLCVFSIAGIQSAQAVEETTKDIKAKPQIERKHDFKKIENNKQTDKEIKKKQEQMKKDHEKWQKEKKKNIEKRHKLIEKNKKQWEKDRKQYGDNNKQNWGKNKNKQRR